MIAFHNSITQLTVKRYLAPYFYSFRGQVLPGGLKSVHLWSGAVASDEIWFLLGLQKLSEMILETCRSFMDQNE